MTHTTIAANFKPQSPTGISILIVGAGIGGLAAAIECHRKGHNVRLIERSPTIESRGDLIVVSPSALHTARRSWPGFMEEFQKNTYTRTHHLFKSDDSLIGAFTGSEESAPIPTNRTKHHNLLLRYALSLGIEIEFGKKVESYYETEIAGGVVTADGERIEADVVVAADGVGSNSWQVVTGVKNKSISSGVAVYRATYSLEDALKDPTIKEQLGGLDARVSTHMGKDVHAIVAMSKDHISWNLMHKDDGNADESWYKPAPTDKALKFVESWGPFVPALIRNTPNNTCIDWSINWRNPQPIITSPLGRVVQLGDAAHSLLPTSGNGAVMAVEDALSLASCLRIGTKENIPTALRVHNKLRYERVSCAQRVGFKRRQLVHNEGSAGPPKGPPKNPQEAAKGITQLGRWLWTHDAELYAEENYAKCEEHLSTGASFQNTNIPPGYTYEPWTVADLLEAGKHGPVVDAGEWS